MRFRSARAVSLLAVGLLVSGAALSPGSAPPAAALDTTAAHASHGAQSGAHLHAAVPTSVFNHWHTAPSLVQLRREVDSRWPWRSRASDGTLGDQAHRRSYSDHNPVGHRNGPSLGSYGSVHAIDITAAGISTSTVLNAVIGDSRVRYVIFAGRIWSASYGWVARSSPSYGHYSHIHISLRSDTPSLARQAEQNTRAWMGRTTNYASVSTSSGSSSLRVGSSGPQVKALQEALLKRGFKIRSGATGYFGNQTKATVARFQRAQGWRGSAADGIPGPTTLRQLRLTGSTPTVANTTTKKTSPTKKTTTAKKTTSAGRYYIGARGAHIRTLQKTLLKRGFKIRSGATGYFGNQTKATVARFQRAQGWRGSAADGIPGPTTLRQLRLTGSTPTVANTTTKKTSPTKKTTTAKKTTSAGRYYIGARGAHIRTLQKTLLKRGFKIRSGATGYFGNQTKATVARFQRAQGWRGSAADGIPGPTTLRQLGLR